VNSVGYEVFLLLLQFLYSGQVSIVPQKHEPRPNCGERGCWHTHCTSAVDLALDTLAAARSFGVEQLALLTQVSLLIFHHHNSSHARTHTHCVFHSLTLSLSLSLSLSLGFCASVLCCAVQCSAVLCLVGFGNYYNPFLGLEFRK
jgi:hypothetical protein